MEKGRRRNNHHRSHWIHGKGSRLSVAAALFLPPPFFRLQFGPLFYHATRQQNEHRLLISHLLLLLFQLPKLKTDKARVISSSSFAFFSFAPRGVVTPSSKKAYGDARCIREKKIKEKRKTEVQRAMTFREKGKEKGLIFFAKIAFSLGQLACVSSFHHRKKNMLLFKRIVMSPNKLDRMLYRHNYGGKKYYFLSDFSNLFPA